MPRPIGKNIRAVCLTLEGQRLTVRQVATSPSREDCQKARNIINKAKRLGLLKCVKINPNLYTARPDWRARIDAHGGSKPKPVKPAQPKQVVRRMIVILPHTPRAPQLRNSVFDLRYV